MEWLSGMLQQNGCGGTKLNSKRTGEAPESNT